MGKSRALSWSSESVSLSAAWLPVLETCLTLSARMTHQSRMCRVEVTPRLRVNSSNLSQSFKSLSGQIARWCRRLQFIHQAPFKKLSIAKLRCREMVTGLVAPERLLALIQRTKRAVDCVITSPNKSTSTILQELQKTFILPLPLNPCLSVKLLVLIRQRANKQALHLLAAGERS